MTHQTTLDLAREQRDRIIEGHREDRDELLAEIDSRLKALSKARSSGVVDADDAHEILDDMLTEPPRKGPRPADTRFFGGLWQGDGWQRTGYKASRRPACNARVIAQFKWEGEADG